ncbi:hypothetical protein [Acidisoma cladoniae]|uniref:hypothetical protein n=1 Tax=Acidisoma cladoniae TaxID=3040935 RepID=UPI00254E6845|nr:hypothetical protein [Acidisoma sp. PAMC 29798]
MMLRLDLHNSRRDFNVLAATAFAERAAGIADPEAVIDVPTIKPHRKPVLTV